MSWADHEARMRNDSTHNCQDNVLLERPIHDYEDDIKLHY
jgi:hypothetical protein